MPRVWSRATEVAVCAAGLGLTGVFVCLKVLAPTAYDAIIQEDALLERLQAALYATAAVVALCSALLARRARVS